MKAVFLICCVAIIIMTLVDFGECQAYLCESGENNACSRFCLKSYGLHGECDSYNTCNCNGACIYRGCRMMCSRRQQTGQCDGDRCECL